MGFIGALGQEATSAEVSEVVYDVIRLDHNKLKLVKKMLKETEIYLAMRRLLRDRSGIIIVIDEITAEVGNVKEFFANHKPTRLVEFKTYVKDSRAVHYFTLLVSEPKPPKKQQVTKSASWAERREAPW